MDKANAVAIKRINGKDNEFEVKMILTAGAILSVKHALQQYTISPIAQEVLLFLDREIQKHDKLKAIDGSINAASDGRAAHV